MGQPTTTPPGGGSWTWDEQQDLWVPVAPADPAPSAAPAPAEALAPATASKTVKKTTQE